MASPADLVMKEGADLTDMKHVLMVMQGTAQQLGNDMIAGGDDAAKKATMMVLISRELDIGDALQEAVRQHA